MRFVEHRWLIAGLTIALLCALALCGPFVHSGRAEAQSISQIPADEVSIGVLGLFHSREFVVHSTSKQALMLRAGNATQVLESSSGSASATIQFANDALVVVVGTRVLRASQIVISGRQGESAELRLAVPGKISRCYRGRLEIRQSGRELIAVLRMDRESAVAAVVAAETLADTPIEALKAQAVAARSYFAASRGRHLEFDFCDTTHCQFLRELPAPGSRAAQAVRATRGLVLAYNSQTLAAMYTRSCSGHTLTPSEVGMHSASYPYFSAACKYCAEHPARWSKHLRSRDAASLQALNESSRVQIGRRLGWDAVPSNTFVATKQGDEILMRGTGQGHGIGLCQAGARAMAFQGSSYQQILSHYYPNTTIISLPTS